MNRLAIALAVTFGLATSQATAAQIEFRGVLCLTDTNAVCIAEGWNTGCFSTMRYSPRNEGDNGPRTRLSFFNTFFGENYTSESVDLIGTTFVPVDGTNIGRGGGTFTAQMKITTQIPSPAKLTEASSFVSIIGQIHDFDGIPGCFKASGVKN